MSGLIGAIIAPRRPGDYRSDDLGDNTELSRAWRRTLHGNEIDVTMDRRAKGDTGADVESFAQARCKVLAPLVSRQGRLKLAALLKWENSWKAEVIRHALKIRNRDFIDIGANTGQTSLDFYAVSRGRRYIGFEPNPASFVSLSSLGQKNDFRNCVILPIGLSDKIKISDLNLYTQIGAHS